MSDLRSPRGSAPALGLHQVLSLTLEGPGQRGDPARSRGFDRDGGRRGSTSGRPSLAEPSPQTDRECGGEDVSGARGIHLVGWKSRNVPLRTALPEEHGAAAPPGERESRPLESGDFAPVEVGLGEAHEVELRQARREPRRVERANDSLRAEAPKKPLRGYGGEGASSAALRWTGRKAWGSGQCAVTEVEFVDDGGVEDRGARREPGNGFPNGLSRDPGRAGGDPLLPRSVGPVTVFEAGAVRGWTSDQVESFELREEGEPGIHRRQDRGSNSEAPGQQAGVGGRAPEASGRGAAGSEVLGQVPHDEQAGFAR